MNCQHQIMNLMQLPFAIRHIAVMPDAYAILTTKNAVGADIGCGMSAARVESRQSSALHQLGGGNHLIEITDFACTFGRNVVYFN